jgi:amino acid adenylation domain-containing protein
MDMDASFQRIGESSERRKLFELMLQRKGRGVATTHVILPRHVWSPCAISYAQQRLWFIDQLGEGAGTAYHIQGAVRLLGVLKRDALREALDTILRRHEALRTRFVLVDGSPMQAISEAARFSLQESDLSEYDAVERETHVRRVTQEEACARFDLTAGPLIRGGLLRLSGQEHVLLVTMHHIISDGWSMGILISELCALYAAFKQGKANPLPPLSIQYADYAVWQREWLQGDALERQLAFWKEHLNGAPPLLELPADRPRPISQSYRGDRVRFTLTAGLTNQLRDLAKSYGATLFVTLHAAFAILLSRLSGQKDIVIGVPVANRQRTEIEPLIGFFVNTLALRTLLNDDLSVDAALKQVKATTLAGYANQDVPFEKVVEALNPPRNLSQSPVFQAMLVLQNAPQSEFKLPDLTLAPLPIWSKTEKFDLTLSLHEAEDEIVGGLSYASDLFDRNTIERWVTHFKVALAGMARDATQQVGAVPLLSEDERRQVIAGFNATRVEHSPHKMIHELFEEQVERAPAATAALYEGQQLTYLQLNERANQLAHYLRKHGVGPDQLVAICVERGLDMAVGALGILKAGGAYVPLDPNYPRARMEYMLKDAAPRVVLTQQAIKAALVEVGAIVIALDDDWGIIAQEDVENLSPVAFGLTPRHLGYVIYTSGSTGQPKGVSLSHLALVNLVKWHLATLPPAARVLQFASLSFDASFHEFFSAWGCGGAVVIPVQEIRYDPAALARFLQEQEIDKAIFPVTLLQQIAEVCEDAADQLAHLRLVMATGEQLKITPAIRRLFERLPECALHNHYGPSETHVVTAFTFVESSDRWPNYPSIGRPIDNSQIYILDAHLQPVPIGVVGEIFIAGMGVARGYLNRPELTAERFVADPFSGDPAARMYKTGDLGIWRADGSIEYIGRNDHQVKIRGFRVELGEIEARLRRHEHVNEAVVIAREDVPGEKRLAAFLTNRQGATSSEELRTYLRAHLPGYMVPSAYVQLESIPLTPNGKVDRSALERLAIVDCSAKTYEAPVGEVEEALAAIWQELLKVERVGRHDNFFDLGGHSMLTAKLISRLQQVGLLVSLATVFKYPTLKSLAECLEEGLDQDLAPNPITLRAEGDATPLFMAHEVSGDVLPYLPFARALKSGFPIYGLQRLGIWHLESLEQLAAEHVEAMRRVQPKGPYRLAGWSLGAAIAYEMAYQLIGADEEVEFLGMIDGFAPSGTSRPEMDDTGVLNRFIRDRFSKRLGPAEVEELTQLNDIAQFLEVAKARKYCPSFVTIEDMHRLIKNYRLIPEITDRYSPATLPLTVHFFDAEDVLPNRSRDWEPLIGHNVRRQVIGGTHITIMQPPHIQRLADAMSEALENAADSKRAMPDYCPVFPILLNNPTDAAVFCIPGAGEGIAGFLPLARALGGGVNVYGLQPRGLDDDLAPHSSVTAAAKFYVEAIRKMSHVGPYRLIGHSFGGWVAFEMARQLRQQGQDVAPVIILDAEAPRGRRRRYTRIDIFLRLIETIEQAYDRELGLTAQELRPLDNKAQMALFLSRMVSAGILPPDTTLDTVHRVMRVFTSNLNTVYLPQSPIDSALALFQPTLPASAEREQERVESAADWRQLSPSLSLFQAPGNHMTMLRSPHIQHVTENIRRLWG